MGPRLREAGERLSRGEEGGEERGLLTGGSGNKPRHVIDVSIIRHKSHSVKVSGNPNHQKLS